MIRSQLLLLNPCNHPVKQCCEIPIKVAVEFIVVVAVAMTVQVAVAFGKFGKWQWHLVSLDKHSRRAVPAHHNGRKVL